MKSNFFEEEIYTDVIISNAVWDMGLSFRGHGAYYKALSSILSFFDKPTTFDTFEAEKKTILLGLHYINTTLCTSDKCRVCNHELIQEYVRESQKRAVSCSNTPIRRRSHFSVHQSSSEVHNTVCKRRGGAEWRRRGLWGGEGVEVRVFVRHQDVQLPNVPLDSSRTPSHGKQSRICSSAFRLL